MSDNCDGNGKDEKCKTVFSIYLSSNERTQPGTQKKIEKKIVRNFESNRIDV